MLQLTLLGGAGDGESEPGKPKTERGGVSLVYRITTEVFYRREAHSHERIKLSEGDLNMCISTAVLLQKQTSRNARI